MSSCSSSKEMEQYVVNCGYETTSDIFIVFENVYMRCLAEKQYVIKHPYDVIEHRLVQYNEYLCWCYHTNQKSYITAEVFYTQFKLYKFLKEEHKDFLDNLMQDILDYDLWMFAIESEHLF